MASDGIQISSASCDLQREIVGLGLNFKLAINWVHSLPQGWSSLKSRLRVGGSFPSDIESPVFPGNLGLHYHEKGTAQSQS